MTHYNPFITQLLNKPVLVKRMLTGAAIGFLLIASFLFIPNYTADPSWPKNWIVKPLIMVPLAGAMGGLSYHFINTVALYKRWSMTLANIVSVLFFIIGLWLGTVLGLDGTMWD